MASDGSEGEGKRVRAGHVAHARCIRAGVGESAPADGFRRQNIKQPSSNLSIHKPLLFKHLRNFSVPGISILPVRHQAIYPCRVLGADKGECGLSDRADRADLAFANVPPGGRRRVVRCSRRFGQPALPPRQSAGLPLRRVGRWRADSDEHGRGRRGGGRAQRDRMKQLRWWRKVGGRPLATTLLSPAALWSFFFGPVYEPGGDRQAAGSKRQQAERPSC